VALALLATALVAVSDLVGNALRNHAYARDLSSATLLARGKLAELEMKYEDEGFRDGDQDDHGDFSDAGHPDVKWEVKLVRPDPSLSADQLISVIAGGGSDPKELMARLMGGGALPGQAGGAAASGGGPTTANPALAAMGGLLQTQLTAFGETVKKSLREMQLTVSWLDGRLERAFTVTTHLLVLNPRAPGGARGNDPEVPPNLVGVTPAAGTPGAVDSTANRAPGGVKQKPKPTPGSTQ